MDSDVISITQGLGSACSQTLVQNFDLKIIHNRNVTSSHLGGSPYPDIYVREIARKLQEGYRMPKPKHVDSKL